MEKDKKVTALYCRLSKDDGSNSESLSIRTQKAMLMEYATRNGFGNCQYYVDDGYSGTNSDRPAFQELLDCRALGLPQEKLARLFAEKAHLALNDGTMFGKPGEGFMRLNVGCPRSVLQKALEQLSAAVKEEVAKG